MADSHPTAPHASVRLEVRLGGAAPAAYDLGDGGFLVGSVPGCDLRLPGTNLPPVLALIARQPEGASLRKLAPVAPVAVNGRPVSAAALRDGDRVALGGAEITIRFSGAAAAPADDDGRDLAARYRARRDRLARRQEAVRRASRAVRARQQELDAREAELAPREAMAEAGGQQLARERELLDEQHRLVAARQQELTRELSARTADLEAREARLVADKDALEKGQKQHQADLVRLDRLQAALEARQRQLAERARETDRRFEQMQRDARAMEEQAAQLDEWHTRLSADADQLEARQKEHAAAAAALDQRASAVEGQQAMLATLRTRLERLRDEVRRQEQALSEARQQHEAAVADIDGRLEEAERLRAAAANDKQLMDEERRRFEERRTLLEQAVAQLRQARETLEVDQAEVSARREQIDAEAAELAGRTEALLTRGEQVEQMGERLQADRQALADREEALGRAEQALAVLQGQVRRRADELDDRQKDMDRAEADLAGRAAKVTEQLALHEEGHRRAGAELEALRGQLDERAGELERRSAALAEREREVEAERQRFDEARRGLTAQQQALGAQRLTWEVERDARLAEQNELHEELLALAARLPEMELAGAAAIERLGLAREQLRGHLAEVHELARQGREAVEAGRRQVLADADRLGEGREDHRLAVAAFRQQLTEWQGKVAELRQSLRLGGARLEQQKAQVEEQARQVASTTARLAVEAEELARQRRDVAERRGEVEQHLSDMREWYRRKWRQLAGVDAPPDDEPAPPAAVLSMADEVAPADRQLGERLAGLELVDADTLQALWAEARRQRRPLRQLLLAEGYLTLYQMALIEAGNLDGLVLGPVRVIDKLPSTPREAVYRVFDPRSNGEAVLRHLAEAEMYDAVRPDEFVQRFTAAAAVSHPNVAAVREVLTIAERPAVLVEYVAGLPSGDWPALAAAPGVWYRLVSQAAVALQAAHAAGLGHGHLEASSLVLTPKGVLKLVGLGEPCWLAGRDGEDDGPAGDLAALGALAEGWSRLAPGGKSARSKPLPDELRALLARLQGEGEPIASAQALVEELERAGAKVPASGAAWDRLLRHLREQAPAAGLRSSA